MNSRTNDLGVSEQVLSLSEHLAILRQEYADFCSNEFRAEQQLFDEFKQLYELPYITKIAFGESEELNKVLILQTIPIVLWHAGQRYDIGEMAMVFMRKPNVNKWFYNLTRQVSIPFKNPVAEPHAEFINRRVSVADGAHHPHVNSVGTLCTDQVQFILQEISAGNILSATKLCREVLNTYTAGGNPFVPIEHW